MLASSIPAKLQLPFAANATAPCIRAIPNNSQIGILAGAASFNDGFPPLNFTDPAAGGVDVSGRDMNGVLNQLSALLLWYSVGGSIPYDATLQTAIGGYPKGAVVASLSTAGHFYQSTADNNTTNPDIGGAGWVEAYEAVAVAAAASAQSTANAAAAAAAAAQSTANGAASAASSAQSTANTALSLVPAGTVFAYSGPGVPTGFLAVPTVQTLVSTASYPALFSALGYYWGSGSGTFGLPYLASGYVPVQGAIAALTHGALLAHTHVEYTSVTGGSSNYPLNTNLSVPIASGASTGSTGGADNLAAGMGVQYIVKY